MNQWKFPSLQSISVVWTTPFIYYLKGRTPFLLIKSVINKGWVSSLYLLLLIVPYIQVQHVFCCLKMTAFLYTYGLSSQWKSEAAWMHFVAWFFIICNNLTGFHKYLSILDILQTFRLNQELICTLKYETERKSLDWEARIRINTLKPKYIVLCKMSIWNLSHDA